MPGGLIVILLSALYSLFLLIKVESILGQKFIIISGDNIWNARGIQISDTTYFILWVIALAGYAFGGWLIFSDIKDKKNFLSHDLTDDKKCPKCAETIKYEAKICKHCGHEFTDKEIELEKEKRRKRIAQDEFAFKRLTELRLLQIAYEYQYNQNNLSKAKFYLERLLKEYPDGEYMAIAEKRLHEIQKANYQRYKIDNNSESTSVIHTNDVGIRWFIYGVSGPLKEKVVELTSVPLVIGRDPEESNLIIPPPNRFISKKHCIITYDEGGEKILIEDCGSKNGTFIYGGEKLDTGRRYVLENGDRFYLAEPGILFEIQRGK
jgi:hypothetical protein